ncbi:peptidylprolyl isomerase [Roseivivax sp. CAU 1753]
MPRLSLKLATAALIAVAAPAFAQDEAAGGEADLSTVMATVNGQEITLGHMIMVRASLPEQYQQLPADVLFNGILDQLIQQEALSQSDGAVATDTVRIALQNEERALLASEAVNTISDGAVSEEAIRAAYEAEFAIEGGATEYNASHILVETEEEAQALVAEIEGGADFAELAKEKSTGPSGPGGGSLGWFSAGQMVAEFQTAVETLEPGAVSAPVKTQFGWHVVKLNETRLKEAPALEEVRAQLEQTLMQQVVEEAIEALVADAEVTRPGAELDPELLTRVDLLNGE